MIYCIDIDGTICSQEDGSYQKAKPFKNRIKRVNELYDEGHTIFFLTARGAITRIDWTKITLKQLKKWGVKFHKLCLTKPSAHYYIDDKGIHADEFFKDFGLAVITGGEGGIGKAIVEVLAEDHHVVVLDKKEGIDITDKKQMEEFIKAKQIDVLVNCAGIASGSWKNIIDVNLTAVYDLCKLVYPKMKRKGGSIINITSLWSERGFKGNPAYGASKGGLKQLTKALAMDWAKDNIRVNNLGLGYFHTDMTDYSWKYRRQKVISHIPLGRWGEPNDIKEAIRFLIKSKYVTGQDIYVDGGWLSNGGF